MRDGRSADGTAQHMLGRVQFSAQQKTETVLASLRGPMTIAQFCREHEISESLLRKWREQFLAAGAERLQGNPERTEVDELRGQVAQLERALGRKSMEVEIAGELFAGEAGWMRSRQRILTGTLSSV